MEPRGPGYIKLISITPNAEKEIVRAARISYDDFDKITDQKADQSLLRYMFQNKHTSPFEMVVVKFEICAPLSILTQILRHRTGSYNVLSHRYTPADKIFDDPSIKPWYSPIKCADDIRVQSSLNRQSSKIGEELDDQRELRILESFRRLDELMLDVFDLYNSLLKDDVGREIARFYLPCGTYTKAVCQFNLHNLLHFIRLRTHPHAQLEIQEYANKLVELIRPHIPFVMKMLDEECESVTFNAEEIRMIKGEEQPNARKQNVIDTKLSTLGLLKTE